MIYCSLVHVGHLWVEQMVSCNKKENLAHLYLMQNRKTFLFIQKHGYDFLPFTGKEDCKYLTKRLTVAFWQTCEGVSFTFPHCCRKNILIAFMKIVHRIKLPFSKSHSIFLLCLGVLTVCFFVFRRSGIEKKCRLGTYTNKVSS